MFQIIEFFVHPRPNAHTIRDCTLFPINLQHDLHQNYE